MNEGHYEIRKQGKRRYRLKRRLGLTEHFPTKELRCVLRALAQGKRPRFINKLSFFYREWDPEFPVSGLSTWKRALGEQSRRGSIRIASYAIENM